MVHIAKSEAVRRRYVSPLRDEQAEQTRERILEGLIRIMARGAAELSMPAVAREAGVSVPTVYRHFASKRELVAALAPYAMAKTRMTPDSAIETLDQLDGFVEQMFERHERIDPVMRAAMESQLGNEVRRAQMPVRRRGVRTLLERETSGIDDVELERLTDIIVILLSSATAHAYRDYLSLDVHGAAERVSHAVRLVVAGAQATKGR